MKKGSLLDKLADKIDDTVIFITIIYNFANTTILAILSIAFVSYFEADAPEIIGIMMLYVTLYAIVLIKWAISPILSLIKGAIKRK